MSTVLVNRDELVKLEISLKQDEHHVTHKTEGQSIHSDSSIHIKKSQIRLKSFITRAPIVQSDALCKDIVELFEQQKQCECIVMEEGVGRVVGMAMRNRFSYKLAHRYSVALFYNKQAIDLVDSDPIIVDHDIDPRKLIQLAMSRKGEYLYDCIVITERDRYIGVLTMGDILRVMRALESEVEQSKVETIDKICNTIEEIAKNVTSVHRVAEIGDELSMNMVDYTLQGKEVLSKVQTAFGQLEQSATLTEQSMALLQQEAGAIRAVSNSIQQLAEQSNLLSINATIEAAHAGEYGRGFSVVASEFTNLAHATKDSAKQISILASTIIEAIETAYEHVKNGKTLTSVSTTHVDTAQEVYHHIFKSAVNNKNNVKEISEQAQHTYIQTIQVVRDIAMLNIKNKTQIFE